MTDFGWSYPAGVDNVPDDDEEDIIQFPPSDLLEESIEDLDKLLQDFWDREGYDDPGEQT